MIIIGIDPGTIKTGYGVISYEFNEFKLIDSGVINSPKTGELSVKLKAIYEKIFNLLSLYNPDEFAIESAFYGKNVQSAIKLGHARGVAFLAAAQKELNVSEYSPREVKRAVVGNGAASKEQVNYMVKALFNLADNKMKFDESDALAVAVCHALRMKSIGKSKRSWKDFIEDNPDRIID